MNFLHAKTNLYELLPQSETTILTDNMQRTSLIKLFIKICKDVIEGWKLFYIEKKFSKFDPHVGEAACQTRALLLHYIYVDTENIYFDSNIIKQLGKKIYSLESALRDPTIFQTYGSDWSITKFIDFFEISYEVPTYIVILYLCHILTKYKTKINEEIYIDVEHFMSEYEISRKKTKKFIHYLQNKAAFYSCEFIFYLSSHYKFCSDLKFLLKPLLKQDDDDRFVLPCYFTMKSMLSYIRNKKLKIFAKITLHGKNFITSINIEINENGQPTLFRSSYGKNLPCFVIEADAITNFYSEEEYLRQLFQYNIHELILNYMAAHPQYTGKKLANFADDPFNSSNNPISFDIDTAIPLTELSSHKFLADELGCSNKNKTTFFIRHIYCENVMNLQQEQTTRYTKNEIIPFALGSIS